MRRGKTLLTQKLIETLKALGLGSKITVIDLAPNYRGVGTPLNVEGIKVLRPEKLYAPRLMGRKCEEIWALARQNADATTKVFREFLRSPTPVLVVNDLTIHLHAGEPSLVIDAMERTKLFIANAYYGESLRDECGLWERERKLLEELFKRVDVVWRL